MRFSVPSSPIFLSAALLLLAARPAAADCSHPYFTAKTGTTWTWKDSGGNLSSMKVVKAEGNKLHMENAFVKSPDAPKTDKTKKQVEEGDVTMVSVTTECSADGIRLEFGVAMKGSQNGSLKMVSQEGYTLPAAKKLKVGETWNESKVMSMEAGGGPVMMKMESKTLYKVIGTEKVKVPAGSYDALKIQGETETTMVMEGPMAAMMPKQPPQKSTSTMWIAKGVGMVKTEMPPVMGAPGAKPEASEGGEAKKIPNVSELVSYTK